MDQEPRISGLKITLTATYHDGTTVEGATTVEPSIYTIEDARVITSLDASMGKPSSHEECVVDLLAHSLTRENGVVDDDVSQPLGSHAFEMALDRLKQAMRIKGVV